MRFHLTPARRAGAAFCAALLVMVLAWWGFERKEQKILSTQKMATVLRAKKYIPTGRKLSADVVEEVSVPELALTAGTFTKKTDLIDAQGAVRFKTRVAIPKGETVCRPYVMDDNAALGLAWALEPGQTALTLRLNSEDAVAGLLKPGDRVHVISTVKEKTLLLFSRVLVGAVGEKILDSSRQIEPNDLSKPLATDSILVTLFLTPAEALTTRAAGANGSLTLTLASPLGG